MKNPFYKAKKQKTFLKPLSSNNKQFKSSDVNILLNRVKLNEKLELRKKIYSILIGLLGISIFTVLFLR